MNQHSQTTGILEAARQYAAMNLPIIPLNGKVPAIKDWQTFVANAVNVQLWFSPERRANIGLRTGESGYVVIDTDSAEAEAWVKAHCPESPMQAVTGSGSTHRYFANPPRKEIRNRQGLKRIHGLDVRGHGGYIVLPPSIHPETGKPYRGTITRGALSQKFLMQLVRMKLAQPVKKPTPMPPTQPRVEAVPAAPKVEAVKVEPVGNGVPK